MELTAVCDQKKRTLHHNHGHPRVRTNPTLCLLKSKTRGFTLGVWWGPGVAGKIDFTKIIQTKSIKRQVSKKV